MTISPKSAQMFVIFTNLLFSEGKVSEKLFSLDTPQIAY